MVMLDWGDKWFRASEGPATMLTHASCGGEFRPVLHCSVCGLELRMPRISRPAVPLVYPTMARSPSAQGVIFWPNGPW
jgi:hypothetical protein